MSDGQEFESPMEENPVAPITAWQMLREAREARGLSVVEVAQHLKLTPRQVEAMEAGDLAHLPGPAFARGFVRNYARFLHLDPTHFNAALDVVREVPPPFDTLPLGQMPGPASWRFSSLPALGIAAALLALAVAGWHYRWFEPREEQYLADVMGQSGVPAALAESMPAASVPQSAPASAPLGEQSTAVGAQSSAPVAAPVVDIVAASAVVVTPAASGPVASSAPVAAAASSVSKMTSSSAIAIPIAASAPVASAVPKTALAPLAQSAALSGPVPKGSHRLRFSFDADAWVEVRDAGDKVIFSRLSTSGSTQEVQGEAPLQIVIGNAPDVHLTVDGKVLDLASRTHTNVARFSLP
ncbi:MAG: helix-turn-helix protein [Rhodocyclales bacterium]|nr:helix-turn-helix protein [Rhodocyclales bacterium]